MDSREIKFTLIPTEEEDEKKHPSIEKEKSPSLSNFSLFSKIFNSKPVEKFPIQEFFPDEISRIILSYSMEDIEDVKKAQDYFGTDLLRPFDYIVSLEERITKELINPFLELKRDDKDLYVSRYKEIKDLPYFEVCKKEVDTIFESIKDLPIEENIELFKWVLLRNPAPSLSGNAYIAYESFETLKKKFAKNNLNVRDSLNLNFGTRVEFCGLNYFIRTYIVMEILPKLIRAEIGRCIKSHQPSSDFDIQKMRISPEEQQKKVDQKILMIHRKTIKKYNQALTIISSGIFFILIGIMVNEWGVNKKDTRPALAGLVSTLMGMSVFFWGLARRIGSSKEAKNISNQYYNAAASFRVPLAEIKTIQSNEEKKEEKVVVPLDKIKEDEFLLPGQRRPM